MALFKAVPVPDRGVDWALKPHAIDPRAWYWLAGFRTKNGAIRSFNGWNSILATPLGEPILGVSEYFRPLTLQRFYMLLTGTHAYSYDPTTGITTDVTGAAVLNATASYPWTCVAFGGEIHFSSLYTDGIWKWGGSGDIVQIADSPSFAHMSTLNDYLIGFYERLGSEHYPFSFRWAAEGHDDWWIASETIDAGEFPIDDTPDKAVALYRLGNDMIAYKDRTIIPVTFIGGNEVFGRRAGVNGVGLIGPYAIAAAGDRHLFLGQETFYSYTGGNVVDDTFGDLIRDLVFPELNLTLAHQTRAINLRKRLEIVWFYPDNNIEGPGCNRAVIYNLKDGTWAGPMSITDMISFCNNVTTVIPNHEDVLGTVSGKLMGHGMSYTEDGTAQLRTMESGDLNLQTDAVDESGQKVFFPLSTVFQANVLNVDIEGTTGAPVANVYVGSRLDLNDAISWEGPHAIVGGSTQTIRVPIRRTGRWFRVKIECNENKELAILGYQFEFERVGAR